MVLVLVGPIARHLLVMLVEFAGVLLILIITAPCTTIVLCNSRCAKNDEDRREQAD